MSYLTGAWSKDLRAVSLRMKAAWKRLMEQLPRTWIGRLSSTPDHDLAALAHLYIIAIAHEAGWEIPEGIRENGKRGQEVCGGKHYGARPSNSDLSIRKLTAMEAHVQGEGWSPGLLGSYIERTCGPLRR